MLTTDSPQTCTGSTNVERQTEAICCNESPDTGQSLNSLFIENGGHTKHPSSPLPVQDARDEIKLPGDQAVKSKKSTLNTQLNCENGHRDCSLTDCESSEATSLPTTCETTNSSFLNSTSDPTENKVELPSIKMTGAASLTSLNSDGTLHNSLPFPFPVGEATQAGRKHSNYQNKSIRVNEDLIDYFAFSLFKTSTYFSDAEHSALDSFENTLNDNLHKELTASCFFLADGHGEVANVPLSITKTTAWAGTKGEQFMRLFKVVVKDVIIRLVQSIFDDEATSLDKTEYISKIFSNGFDSKYSELTSSLEDLHKLLDIELERHDPSRFLLNENGCTLILGLVIHKRLWMCNIGDSSMMIFDREKGAPLSVWKRQTYDKVASICSYEDTLANFPVSVREGQTPAAVKFDLDQVMPHLRRTISRNGLPYHKIVSPHSPYGLALTNTVGNLHHKGCLVGMNGQGRTTVYKFDISELIDMTASKQEVTVILCSDGVKDVLSAVDIGLFTKSIEFAIYEMVEYDDQAQDIDLEDARIESLISKLRRGYSSDRFDLRATSELLDIVLKESACPLECDLDDLCRAIVALAVLRKSYDDLSVIAVTFFADELSFSVIEKEIPQHIHSNQFVKQSSSSKVPNECDIGEERDMVDVTKNIVIETTIAMDEEVCLFALEQSSANNPNDVFDICNAQVGNANEEDRVTDPKVSVEASLSYHLNEQHVEKGCTPNYEEPTSICDKKISEGSGSEPGVLEARMAVACLEAIPDEAKCGSSRGLESPSCKRMLDPVNDLECHISKQDLFGQLKSPVKRKKDTIS